MAGNAVEALRIILGDNPDAPLLSIRTRAQISLLAKQRIFSRAVNLLTSGFDGCSVPGEMNGDPILQGRKGFRGIRFLPDSAFCTLDTQNLCLQPG